MKELIMVMLLVIASTVVGVWLFWGFMIDRTNKKRERQMKMGTFNKGKEYAEKFL